MAAVAAVMTVAAVAAVTPVAADGSGGGGRDAGGGGGGGGGSDDGDAACWGKRQGQFFYNTLSSPQDCSKHFTLYFPGRPVQSDTILASLGSIQPCCNAIMCES